MSMRIDLDFCHGLAEPKLTRDTEGHPCLSVSRGQETVIIHMSPASLEALWLAVTIGLSELKRC